MNQPDHSELELAGFSFIRFGVDPYIYIFITIVETNMALEILSF